MPNAHTRTLDLARSFAIRQSQCGRVAQVLRFIDDPQNQSAAWPGANPALSAFDGQQLTLPLTFQYRKPGQSDRHLLDTTSLDVRRLPAEGTLDTLDAFLSRHHYSGRRGMNGPAFGLYHRDGKEEQLVGVCTFGRIAYPHWARKQFRPLASDLDRVRLGLMTDHGLANRLVNESEYLEVSRLALITPGKTAPPIGRGTSSWFVARCLHYFEERNRRLWIAATKAERGLPLGSRDVALLAEADLCSAIKGLGFLKAVASFSDPWEGHLGVTYQALGFHHAGRTDDGRWQMVYFGQRSNESVHKRTLRKAIDPSESNGHDTATLRLIWEGGCGSIRVSRNGELLYESDGHWIMDGIEGKAFDRAIQARWRRFRQKMRDRFGSGLQFRTVYFGGGIHKEKRPAKHRYVRMLGARYWQHELERRFVHLTERMLRRDRAWRAKKNAPDAFCRGPLPDTRAMKDKYGVSLCYPQSIPEHELKPELRRQRPLDLGMPSGAQELRRSP